jgi:arabinogalactan endo-1,4-beta-galactosidase
MALKSARKKVRLYTKDMLKELAAAGIDRRDVYVTNVVKHLKWEPRGSYKRAAKRRANR